MATSTQLFDRFASFQHTFLTRLGEHDGLNADVAEEWITLEQDWTVAREAGAADPHVDRIASHVAHNVATLVSTVGKIQAAFSSEIDGLASNLSALLSEKVTSSMIRGPHDNRRRQWPPSPSPSNRSLSPSPALTPLSSPPSSPFTPSSPLPITREPADHIREWFLLHLSHPYPTVSEKNQLSLLTQIPRNKIDSDLTNWRRRAGWTGIKDKFAGKDKDKMRKLMEGYERGEEKREEVRAEVEKMKSYLNKEKEYSAGSWIKNLKPAVNIDSSSKSKKRRTTKSTKTDSRPTPPPSANVSPETSLNVSPSFTSLRSTSGSSYSSMGNFDFKPYNFQAPTPASSSTSLLGTKRSNESLLSQDTNAPHTKPRLEAFEGTYEEPGWTVPVHHTSPNQYMLLPDSIAPTASYGYEVQGYAGAGWWDPMAPMPPVLAHMEGGGITAPDFSLPEQHAFSLT